MVYKNVNEHVFSRKLLTPPLIFYKCNYSLEMFCCSGNLEQYIHSINSSELHWQKKKKKLLTRSQDSHLQMLETQQENVSKTASFLSVSKHAHTSAPHSKAKLTSSSAVRFNLHLNPPNTSSTRLKTPLNPAD